MAINFAAKHMQGYNNPKIEIINGEFDDEGNIINITHNDIVKILSRGVFPIVSLPAGGPNYTVSLTFATIEDDKILFTGTDMRVDSSNTFVHIFGLVFTPSEPPVFLQKTI